MKYVVNAEFWLYNQLDSFAQNKEGREKVIKAYRYIVLKLIEHYGIPDLKRGEKMLHIKIIYCLITLTKFSLPRELL